MFKWIKKCFYRYDGAYSSQETTVLHSGPRTSSVSDYVCNIYSFNMFVGRWLRLRIKHASCMRGHSYVLMQKVVWNAILHFLTASPY